MRAVLAVAAFAVAAQAAALPAGEFQRRADLGLPSTIENGPTKPGLDPNSAQGKGTPADPSGGAPPRGSPAPPAGSPAPPAGSPAPPAGSPAPPAGSPAPPAGSPAPPAGSPAPPAGSPAPPAGSPTVYTPYYPTGGYEPPKEYPPQSDYSDSKPYDDNSYTGDYDTDSHPYNPSYPAKNDYGQPDNYGYDYHPSGYTRPSGYDISYPTKGESVECGKPSKISWSGFKGKKVKIEVVYGKGGDDCHHYTTVHDDCDNTGSYEWTPPSNLPPTGGLYGYGYKVTCKDTGDVVYSPQFCFQNNDFYNHFKHPACPTVAPTPITIPCETATPTEAPVPATSPCETPVAVHTEGPAPAPGPATTPCPSSVAVPAAPATNGTSPEAPPPYTGAASGLKASFTFVAGLAVLVAFAL